MFKNLIESGSHKDDLSRKGSFIAATLAIYAVVVLAIFVVGIMTYQTTLGQQDLELTTLVAPVPVPVADTPKRPEEPADKQPPKVDSKQNVDVRQQLVAPIAIPQLVPKEVSAKASDVPPVRAGVITVLGSGNSNAPAPSGPGSGSGTGGSGTVVPMATKVIETDEPPPPEVKPTPPRAPVSQGVLNGKALSLPKPPYPTIARAARAAGTVVVQVLIDENGNVVNATPVTGHPLLQAAAAAAARNAKFSPTKLSGVPVKVTGVIQYNFVFQ